MWVYFLFLERITPAIAIAAGTTAIITPVAWFLSVVPLPPAVAAAVFSAAAEVVAASVTTASPERASEVMMYVLK